MIKGVFQNAVVINNPGGGKVFRQAIFLVRPDVSDGEFGLEEEARRVIEESTSVRRKKKSYR